MNFNFETKIDASEWSETKTSIKHELRYDEMVDFEKTAVKKLKKIHFQLKVINSVFCWIPRCEKEVSEILKTKNELPSVPKWKFTTSIPLKALLNEHQYHLPLQHVANRIILYPLKGKKMF